MRVMNIIVSSVYYNTTSTSPTIPAYITHSSTLLTSSARRSTTAHTSAPQTSAGARRGIVGYCWGGTVAWHGATRTGDFAAAVGWYGGGIAAAKAPAYLALKNIACVGGSWMCPRGAAAADIERMAREAAGLKA